MELNSKEELIKILKGYEDRFATIEANLTTKEEEDDVQDDSTGNDDTDTVESEDEISKLFDL